MIDRIIYTYVPEAEEGKAMGFRSEEVFLSFFKASVEQSLKSVSEVLICGSKDSIEHLAKVSTIGALKGVDLRVVNYSEFPFDKRFWNFYKIISLYLSAQEGVPAVHVDLDLKLDKKLTKKILSSDVVCEARRPFYIPHSRVSNRIPKRVLKDLDPFIICSGIYGANDVNLIIDFFELANKVVAVDFHNNEPITSETRIMMEESMFTIVCKRHEAEVVVLKPKDFTHLQGGKKMMI